MTCNVTDTHTVFVGDDITYACSFDYQGLWYKNKGNWTGPGVRYDDQLKEVLVHHRLATADEYESEIGKPPSGVLKLVRGVSTRPWCLVRTSTLFS